jgi:hypothetical protein
MTASLSPDENDPVRHQLAKQLLDAAEAAGFRVWQQFGCAEIARPVRSRLMPAPKHWRHAVAALSYEVACLLDWDAPPGVIVERAPGSKCLVYRPEWPQRPSDHRDEAAWGISTG